MIKLEDLYAVEDPAELFELSTQGIAEHQDIIEQLSAIRARAVAMMHAAGRSYKDLADEFRMSAPRVGQLVNSNDVAAMEVLKAWIALEGLLTSVVGEVSRTDRIDSRQAIEHLRRSKTFDPDALAELEGIYEIRNQLAHGRLNVTPEAAKMIADKATYLTAMLVLWQRKDPAWEKKMQLYMPSLRQSPSSDQLAKIEVERRHAELAPSTRIRPEIRANTLTGSDSLWLVLANETNRSYRFKGQVFWQEGSWSELSTGEIDAHGEESVFIASPAPLHVRRIKLQYRAWDWDSPCPCDRPDEYGHWSETRLLKLPGR